MLSPVHAHTIVKLNKESNKRMKQSDYCVGRRDSVPIWNKLTLRTKVLLDAQRVANEILRYPLVRDGTR